MKTSDSETIRLLPKLASYASLLVALTLVGLKIWAWVSTGSVSILSSLADSLLDVIASAITVVAVWASSRPADREHRFGHGKAEGLAALVQSMIITLSALYVCYEAIQRLIQPRPIEAPAVGLGVMVVSILLTFALVSFQRYVVKRTGSMAIAADAVHYRMDLLINAGVAIAVVLSSVSNFALIDPLVGIVISGYILHSIYGIATQALGVLLDRELPETDRAKIVAIATAHPEVRGFHDLRTRYGGSRYFIQFHLELAPETSLYRTHEILDEVEDEVRRAFPHSDIIVHPDPLGFEERRDHFD
jgi:ferrous-iron efflux pump FieF